MTASRLDALVLFGVAGDLAHKMIVPALFAKAKRGALKVPVIGIAFPKWSLARLHKRVTDSIKRSGGIDNRLALHHLLSLLRYVSGDYEEPGIFTALKKVLGSARLPAHYLAIPPSLHHRDRLAADIQREGAESIVKAWKEPLDPIFSKGVTLKPAG